MEKKLPEMKYEEEGKVKRIEGRVKEQVAGMMIQVLNIKEAPKLLDATDALGVALCHHYQKGKPVTSKSKGWEDFVAKNPGRVK